MALVAYKKTGLTGGTASDLDSIDGADLSGGEIAFVFLDGDVYFYELDESSGASENSPDVIAPDANPGNKRWILHGIILGGEIDFQGNYALQLQNIPDLASKGAGYRFDGNDDNIIVSNPLTSIPPEASILVRFRRQIDSGAQEKLIDSDGDELSIEIRADDTLRAMYYSASLQTATSTEIINIDEWHVAIASFNFGNSINLYLDGNLWANNGSPTGALATAVTAYNIGRRGGATQYFEGCISSTLLFNLALTATEVKALSSGSPVPYKYTGASQMELMPNQVDRDFSGASAWADVDLAGGGGAYDETGDLTITAGGAGVGDYCTCPVLSAPTTIGLEYRMTYDLANLVGSWTLQSFDGTQTIGTISANATQASLRWTAETTGGYRLVAAENNASGDFDNFTLNHIGCVLQLEQDGIGHQQWIDKSSNELHGTVSGAVPTNLPTDHTEKYVDLTVTGNTSFTLPKGYQIKSIICKETAGNALTGGVDIGFAVDGIDVVAGMAIGANATVNCTLVAAGTIGATHTTADDTIYISDGDNDTNWNGAELEVRVEMERLTVN